MKPTPDMTVGYVDAEGNAKKGKIVQVHSDTAVLLDHSEKNDGTHMASASFNADKTTPNTWHFTDEGTAAPAAAAGPKRGPARSAESA